MEKKSLLVFFGVWVFVVGNPIIKTANFRWDFDLAVFERRQFFVHLHPRFHTRTTAEDYHYKPSFLQPHNYLVDKASDIDPIPFSQLEKGAKLVQSTSYRCTLPSFVYACILLKRPYN